MATPGRERTDGGRPWLAHWREDNGRQRTKTFETRAAAEDWEGQKRRERDAGILGQRTLAHETRLEDWIREWWKLQMASAPLNTRENYARVINKYLGPELGRVPMAQLRPDRIAAMRDELVERGETPSAVAYAMTVLSSCLGKAVERGYFDFNPCASISKPAERSVRKQKWPPSPEEIEALRHEFLAYQAPNSGAWTALRSATIVSVMGYAGLRPEEVMGLKLDALDAEARILRVEDVFALEHRPGDTKTHYQRVVELLDAPAADLRQWIGFAGLDDPAGWMFPPRPGGEVAASTHRNWAARPWKRARDAVVKAHPEFQRTLGHANPRDLRSAYVSLLARAGHSDADIAEMSGHSVEVLRRHYMGALRTLRRLPRLAEDEQIALARTSVKGLDGSDGDLNVSRLRPNAGQSNVFDLMNTTKAQPSLVSA